MHPYEPAPDPLTMPIGALANQHDAVQSGSSVRIAAQAMAEAGLHAILVARGTKLVGIVDEPALLAAMSRGIGPNEAVDAVMDPEPLTVAPHMTGAEALRLLNSSGRHAIAVVDVMGNAVGIVTPSRLFHPPRKPYQPQIVGGLATPFGVYLTNGIVTGGAKGLALVTAGATLYFFFLASAYAVLAVGNLFHLTANATFTANLWDVAAMLLFLLVLRLSPIAGTHGAEHMVVHAIERGEELTPEVVRRMPRVHPRCGTNLAVGASIFMAIFLPAWADPSLRLFVAAIVTLGLWRTVGSFVQYVFTTKRPTDAQLLGGIRAGQELLAASARSQRRHPGFLRRFASSGILHVMVGAMAASALTEIVLAAFRVPEAWRVIS